MSIKVEFRNPFFRYSQLFFAILTIVVSIIAVYVNIKDRRESSMKIEKARIEQIKDAIELEIRNRELTARLDTLLLMNNRFNSKIENNSISDKATSSVKQFDKRLLVLENKITVISNTTEGLRQAINPLKPEEVLTIARLKDELVEIRSNFSDFEETIKSKQQAFEESIRHEAASSNQSTTLILVVLIPLVLNFLYTVWKDFKKSDKKEKDE